MITICFRKCVCFVCFKDLWSQFYNVYIYEKILSWIFFDWFTLIGLTSICWEMSYEEQSVHYYLSFSDVVHVNVSGVVTTEVLTAGAGCSEAQKR